MGWLWPETLDDFRFLYRGGRGSLSSKSSGLLTITWKLHYQSEFKFRSEGQLAVGRASQAFSPKLRPTWLVYCVVSSPLVLSLKNRFLKIVFSLQLTK